MVTNYNPQSIFSLPCAPQATISLGNGCGFVLLCEVPLYSNSIGYVMAVDGSNMSDPIATPIVLNEAMYPLNLYNKSTFTLFSNFFIQEYGYVRSLSFSNEGQFIQRSQSIETDPNSQGYIVYQLSSTNELNVIGLNSGISSFISFDSNLYAITYDQTIYSSLTNQLSTFGGVFEQYYANSKKLITTIGATTNSTNNGVYSMVYNTEQDYPSPLSGLIGVSGNSIIVNQGCTATSTLIDGENIVLLWQDSQLTNFYFQIINSNGTLMLENPVMITPNPYQYDLCNTQMTALENNAIMFTFVPLSQNQAPQSIIFNSSGIQQGDFFTINNAVSINTPIYLENNYIMIGMENRTGGFAMIFDTGLIINNKSSGPVPTSLPQCVYYHQTQPAIPEYQTAEIVTTFITNGYTVVTGNNCYLLSHSQNSYEIFSINGTVIVGGVFPYTSVNSGDGFGGVNKNGNIAWLASENNGCGEPTQFYLQTYSNTGNLLNQSIVFNTECGNPFGDLKAYYQFGTSNLELSYTVVVNEQQTFYNVVFDTLTTTVLGSYNSNIYSQSNLNIINIGFYGNGYRLALYSTDTVNDQNLYGAVYTNDIPPRLVNGPFTINTPYNTNNIGSLPNYVMAVNDTLIAVGWTGNYMGEDTENCFHQLVDISGNKILQQEVNLGITNFAGYSQMGNQSFVAIGYINSNAIFFTFTFEGQPITTPFSINYPSENLTINEAPITYIGDGYLQANSYNPIGNENSLVYFNINGETGPVPILPQCGSSQPTSTPAPPAPSASSTSTPSHIPGTSYSSTPTPTQTPGNTTNHEPIPEGLSNGAIAGIVIGVLGAVAATAGIWYCKKYAHGHGNGNLQANGNVQASGEHEMPLTGEGVNEWGIVGVT